MSAAGEEGGQDPDGRVQPGDDVADRHADLGRPPAVRVGVTGDRHQATDGLDDEVVAGPVFRGTGSSIAADREVDEGRIDGPKRLVVEPELIERPGAEVLDEDVSVGEQPPQDVAAGRASSGRA